MLSNGNSNPEICLANLLKIARSEIPFERLKGIDVKNFDNPSSTVSSKVIQDIIWVAQTYEPRIYVDEVYVQSLIPKIGDFLVQANTRTGG